VELKAKRESVRKSRGHLLQRGLSLGWGAWSEMLEERAAFLRLLSKGVRFKLDRRLAFGLVSWAQATYRTLRQTEGSGHMSRGVVHFKDRHLARGWTGWHAKWADGVAARMATRKSLGHLLNRGFGAWLEMAIERKKVWEKQGKGLSRTTSRKLGLGIDEWRAAIAPRVDLTVNALSYSINRMLALGWSAWFSTWEGANKRSVLQRGVRQMINRGLSRGWGAWVEMAVERAEVVRKLRKGLSFVISRKVALGFAGWLSAIGHKQMREAQQGHMTKALLHLMNRELSRGWTTWYTTWEALKAKRGSMRKSLSHMLNHGLSRGWGAWLEMAVERGEIIRKLLKGLSFVINRKVALGFAGWLSAIILQQMRETQQGQKTKALLHLMNKAALLHLMNRELSRGWSAWYLTLPALKAMRDVSRISLSYLRHRGLSLGFGAWLKIASARAEVLRMLCKGLSRTTSRKLALGVDRWVAAIAPRDDPMSKALSYSINRKLALGWNAWFSTWEEVWFSTLKLALGWNAWQSTWEEGSRKRATLQRGLSHILHRLLLRGWGAWVEMAVKRAEFARKLHVGLLAAWAKGLSFMINRKVTLGFAGWLSAIGHKKQMREAQQGHTTKALLHLMNRELSRGWTTWYTTWEEELEVERESMRKRMLNRGLSRGFGALFEMAIERAEVLRMLHQGMNRMTSRKLALAFEEWRIINDTLHRDAPDTPRVDLTPKALSYSINRKLALGWNAWFSTWEEVWFSTLKLALGWNAWQSTWEEGSRKRATLQRGLSHILHRLLLRGWGAWVEMAVKRAEFARKLHVGLLAAWAKGLSFMINRKVTLGFAGWLSAIGHKKQMREAQQGHTTKALLHLMNRELSRGWTTWEALKAKPVPARRLDPLQEAYLHAAMLHALAEAEAKAEEEAVAEAEEEGLIDELWN